MISLSSYLPLSLHDSPKNNLKAIQPYDTTHRKSESDRDVQSHSSSGQSYDRVALIRRILDVHHNKSNDNYSYYNNKAGLSNSISAKILEVLFERKVPLVIIGSSSEQESGGDVDVMKLIPAEARSW